MPAIELRPQLPTDARLSFCLLASGSKGNCLWVQAGGARVMVDCGLGVRALARRSQAVGAEVAGLDAFLLSHTHGDHVSGVARLYRNLSPPFYAHHRVARHCADRRWGEAHNELAPGEVFGVGALEIAALPLPHDAPGTCGFLFEYEGRRAAHLTDLGHVPPALVEALVGVELLSIEANHDEQMLAEGPYPAFLKRRVASPVGHLSNGACAALVCELAARGPLGHVVLAHISETNNTPARARQQVRSALDAHGHRDVQVSVGAQWEPSGAFCVS